MQLLEEAKDLDEEGLKAFLKGHVYDLIPRHIVPDDIVASISYLIGMNYGIGRTDDIDHLGNRRIRSVGDRRQRQMCISDRHPPCNGGDQGVLRFLAAFAVHGSDEPPCGAHA